LNESDSEVLKLDARTYLAATVDSVSEEIAYGLYRDPFTMGWVAAMASLSDLAAVGARPTGILFSTHWGRDLTREQRPEVAAGLRAALKRAQVHLLGGDSGDAVTTQLTVTSLGLCDQRPLSRVGLKPGDLICMTGQSGTGPALGFRHLLGHDSALVPETAFRPVARLREGFRLRSLASAAIDTSDGITSALSTLSRLNSCSFDLEWNPAALSPLAREYCHLHKFPQTALWFGEHGDFQLMCGVPPSRLAQARKAVPGLQVLGTVRRKSAPTRLRVEGTNKPIQLELLSECPKANLRDFRAAFDRMIYYLRREGFP
jgi:thiamine-monophosphate kinase